MDEHDDGYQVGEVAQETKDVHRVVFRRELREDLEEVERRGEAREETLALGRCSMIRLTLECWELGHPPFTFGLENRTRGTGN